MENKYLIFNRMIHLRPISIIDEYGNSRVIELNKSEAIEYVLEQNIKLNEPLFYYLSIAEWQERVEKSKEIFEEFDKVKEDISNQLLEDNELRKLIDANSEKMDNNIKGFILPITVNNNDEYKKKVQRMLVEYSDAVNKPAFESECNLIHDVKLICDNIIEALNLAIEGKDNEAEIILSDVLKIYANHEFGVSELNNSYAFRGIAPFEKAHTCIGYEDKYKQMMSGDLSFYRARVVDKNSNEEIDKIDHIISLPFSKRYKAKDMRFSLKDEVCLYLGTTSYICSKESKWVEEQQKLYMAAFKFNDQGKKLNILNLTVSEFLINGIFNKGLDKDEYSRELQSIMIKIFPLIIATSFTVNNSDEIRKEKYKEVIKYEYLLSQRLIKAIQKVNIDGVAYLSRQGENDLQYPHGVNLAVPMGDICERKEYSDLYKCFEITKPILLNEENLKKEISEEISYINKHYLEFHYDNADFTIPNIMSTVFYKDKQVFYGKTPFSKLDNYLATQEYYEFHI